ncbi:MAG: hypothetical protein R3C26_11675 [Calditrichia bacterium]
MPLFIVAATTGENPGFGMDGQTGAAIYGMYTALVYLLALPGGWIADRLIGQQQAVFYGGIIIAGRAFLHGNSRKILFLYRINSDRHRAPVC